MTDEQAKEFKSWLEKQIEYWKPKSANYTDALQQVLGQFNAIRHGWRRDA